MSREEQRGAERSREEQRSRIACVSPVKRSVSRTSGCEKSARPCEKERLFHQPRGTTSTITPITEFQSSGAVPMPTDELPVMESRSATVQPSGKGQLQTERSPTSDSDASSRPRRTLQRQWPS